MNWSTLLLFFLGLVVINATWKAESQDYLNDYDDEVEAVVKEDKFEDVIAHKKEIIRERRNKKDKSAGIDGEEDEDNDEKPVQRKGTTNEIVKKDEGPLEICDGSKSEACRCELNEVNCVNIVFDDDKLLETLDLALSKDNKKLENFKPIVAHFADNFITRIGKNRLPEGMEESLSALYIERNKISQIEANAFEGFKNISKINLEGNRLRTIKSEWFSGDLENTLHYLNLGNNRIKETDISPFKRLKNLKKLVLDGNALILDKDFFEGLDNLDTLSMDDCEFDDKDFPKGLFTPLKNLNKLSLRNNEFTEVPAALEEIPHLQFLDLSETHIAEIHRQSFVGEPEMQQMFFEFMPYLASIQECAFCGLTKLKFLTFHNSSALTFIDENAFGFGEYTDDRTTELVELRLSKSSISKLSLNLLEYEQLEALDLDKAPLNCTCDMMFLKNIKFAGGGSSNARCAYPAQMKGKYIDQAQVKELCGYRYARGYRFFFALFGVISASIIVTVGYILFNKGYRLTNIRNLPMPTLPGANSTYTNLNRQEENELTDCATTPTDNTPDFQPRPQMV